MAQDFPMTEEGLQMLKNEWQKLETVKRPKAKQRIKHARSFCDFLEDSEYEASLEQLAGIDKRIAVIEYMIQQAEIIHPTNTSHVEIGSRVTFQNIATNEQETYRIVGKEEANPFECKISHDSPVAKALLGAKVNDNVMIQTPNGEREVTIIEIT